MKIQLAPQKKSIPFTLQVIDDKGAEIDVELFVTRFSIADATKRDEMLMPYYEDKSLTPLQMVAYIATARVICSVKDSDGNYYFEYENLAEALKSLDDEFVGQLINFVNELNPIGTKKKASSRRSKTPKENS